ncbi:hypothetical protein NM208_g2355 [Fusarium decemcellulare]|uniref:Uncharacterized protein n=1 Tax=Fusarium decemcellulare TaxID=57161 RepID=A0ACC1ST59_9HYPO|nr:hypothetical protein NM208_g2355 [Fusarium decemcellulare]
MHKSEANAGGAGTGPPEGEEQILAPIGSRAPEDVQAAAADALITTDVHFDHRLILPTVALTLTYLAQQMILITYGSVLGYINADVGPLKTYTWMAASWSMTCAVFLPIAGPLGDILGRRYFFIAGNAIGIIAGIVAATAQSVQIVIVGATMSGMAAAFQQLAIAAACEIYPNKYRGSVQALLENAPVAFNAAGSLIAHSLVETSWRYIFYIYVTISGCAMISTALFYHPPLPHQEQTRLQLAKNIDWVGAGIWMAGLTCFLLGISWAGGQFAWKSVAVTLPMILGLLSLIGLGFLEVLVCKSTKNPIFPPHIFKNVRGFTNLLITVMILPMPLYAMASIWPAEIGAIFTSDSIKIGIYGLPWGIGSSFGSLITGLLLHYVLRVNWFFTALVALQTIFISLLATITPSSIKPALAFSFLGGAANLGAQLTGIVMVQLSTGDRTIGLATGLLACARSVGGAIATFIYNTIVQSRMQIEWPKRLAEASLPLGALGKLSSLAILAAAAEATRYSFAASFRVVFYLVAGLGSLAVLLAATTRDISQFMTHHVSVDLNKGKRPRIADEAAQRVEHVEDKKP